MKKIYCSLLCCLFCTLAWGQQKHVISGSVQDESGQALAYGDVVLLQAEDSSILTSTLLVDGEFSLAEVVAGDYVLRIGSLGFEDVEQRIQLEADHRLELVMKEDVQLLEEVTVSSLRSAIVNENGNLKINLSNSIFGAQSNSLDLLSMLPSVLVSPDRSSVSIIGRGAPLIYVDNQRITFEDLQAIPVESIKEIEIINNPSARYEANGRAVLLITRKLNFSDGIRMEVSETASFKRGFNNLAGINASVKKNKWEVRSNFSYNQLVIWERIASELEVLPQQIELEQTALSTGPRPQFIFGTGVYRQLGKGDYLSANANLRTHTTEAPITTQSTFGKEGLVDAIESLSEEEEERHFFTSNLNYNNELTGIGRNFFAGFQYSNYGRALKSLISNNFNETGFELDQDRDQDFSIDAWSVRADFEKNIGNGIRWESGINLYLALADALVDFQFFQTADRLQSEYLYEETNYAAYTQLSGQWKKASYTLGLRAEKTSVEGGFSDAGDLLIDRDQLLFFPRLTFSTPLDSNKTLSFNYGVSVRRPNYLSASSISTFITPFVEYSRNANLRPTIIHEASLNFQYKNQSVRLNYVDQQYVVSQSARYEEASGRVITSPENFDRERGFDLVLVNPLNFGKWTMTNYLVGSWRKINDPRAMEMRVRPYAYYYSDHRFKLPAGVTAGFSVWGFSRRLQGAFERNAFAIFNASVQRTFFKNWQFSVTATDIFRNMIAEETFQINEVQSRSTFFADFRNFSFALRYSFGKISKSQYQNKNVDENLDRIN
ncbi:MAG: outer membrane beta-barrel family protein [Bacteroidota bacterium]